MEPYPSYSNCPGEIYDNFEDVLTDEQLEEIDLIIDNATKEKYVVVYHHKHDLTIIRSEFDTMEKALTVAQELLKKDFIVNSVVTSTYLVTV